MYNTKDSKLTDWSKQVSSNGLPKEWTRRYNKIVNIAFSPLDTDLMLLQDHEIFTVINLKKVSLKLSLDMTYYYSNGF